MKTPEYFYKQAAEELNMDLELVTKVNKFFWKEGVKEEIRKAESVAVYVGEIGTLYVNWGRLRKTIIRQIKRLKKWKKNPEKYQKYLEPAIKEFRTLWVLKNKMGKKRNKISNERAARIHKTYSTGNS